MTASGAVRDSAGDVVREWCIHAAWFPVLVAGSVGDGKGGLQSVRKILEPVPVGICLQIGKDADDPVMCHFRSPK